MDLVIRNGMVYDGSGSAGVRADVGVQRGRIARVGEVTEVGAVEYDASGRAVAPGFIDIHTHFDAQLAWDPYIRPQMEHGVTTIVTGNCSLSLAPVRPDQRRKLVGMFSLIEDVPISAFDAGVPFTWETFDGWLGSLRGSLGPNIAPLVGHSALRMWVMGPDASSRAGTEPEVREMCDLLRECLAAGAVGMSTSYLDVDEDFRPVPCRWADHSELEALCATMGEFGRGVLQVVPELHSVDLVCERLGMLGQLSLDTGITTTLSPIFINPNQPDLKPRILEVVESWTEKGARVYPQAQTRPSDMHFQVNEFNLMMLGLENWQRVNNAANDEDRFAALRDAETRAALVAEVYPSGDSTWDRLQRERFAEVRVRSVVDDDNAGLVGRSLAEIGTEWALNPGEALIEIAERDSLGTVFKRDDFNHTGPEVAELLSDDHVLVGASDAGAHLKSFASYGDTSYLLGHFARDTGAMPLERAVRRLSRDGADAWGLRDRGRLEPRYAADIVVFDPATVDRGPDFEVRDLPDGSLRYVRESVGIDAVFVNGEQTWSRASGYGDVTAGRVVPNEHLPER